MNLLYIIIIAVILAMDAFAASISCGMASARKRSGLALKVGSIFGFFQFSLYILGWLLGNISKDIFSHIGAWLAFILLILIGGRMIIEAVRNWKISKECKPLRRREILTLGFATSIDALIVGLSLGVLGSELVLPAIIIGGVTFIMSFAGVEIGDKMRNHLDRWAEIVAGSILIIIAFRSLMGEII